MLRADKKGPELPEGASSETGQNQASAKTNNADEVRCGRRREREITEERTGGEDHYSKRMSGGGGEKGRSVRIADGRSYSDFSY